MEINELGTKDYVFSYKVKPDFKTYKILYIDPKTYCKIQEIFKIQKYKRFHYKGNIFNYHFKNNYPLDSFLKKNFFNKI